MDEQQLFIFNNIKQRIIRDLVKAQEELEATTNYSGLIYHLSLIISDLEDSYNDLEERRTGRGF